MSSNDCRLSFSWPHPGESVQLAGSFNSWQPQPMSRDDDGVWRLELTAVEAGEHQFKFVVDGNWVHDGDQPNVQNEMGSCNNVVTASPEAEGKVTEEPTQETNGVGVPEAMTSSVTSQASASSLPASASPPPKPTIEVERKFSVPANYKTLLEERGFELVKEFKETLSDDYFDSAEYDLMQADHWLRRRNGDWELKYPVRMHLCYGDFYAVNKFGFFVAGGTKRRVFQGGRRRLLLPLQDHDHPVPRDVQLRGHPVQAERRPPRRGRGLEGEPPHLLRPPGD